MKYSFEYMWCLTSTMLLMFSLQSKAPKLCCITCFIHHSNPQTISHQFNNWFLGRMGFFFLYPTGITYIRVWMKSQMYRGSQTHRHSHTHIWSPAVLLRTPSARPPPSLKRHLFIWHTDVMLSTTHRRTTHAARSKRTHKHIPLTKHITQLEICLGARSCTSLSIILFSVSN